MSIATAQELKGCQSQLAKATADAKVAQAAQVSAQREYAQAINKVKALEAKITELQSASVEPIVSEHAILRWLERVNGLNLDNIRTVILGDGTAEKIKFMKSGRIPKDGSTLIIKNNTVVTVE
jgi:hypothetical protein